MLNKNNERELAYVVKVNEIKPITGSDNCECTVILYIKKKYQKYIFYIKIIC